MNFGLFISVFFFEFFLPMKVKPSGAALRSARSDVRTQRSRKFKGSGCPGDTTGAHHQGLKPTAQHSATRPKYLYREPFPTLPISPPPHSFLRARDGRTRRVHLRRRHPTLACVFPSASSPRRPQPTEIHRDNSVIQGVLAGKKTPRLRLVSSSAHEIKKKKRHLSICASTTVT